MEPTLASGVLMTSVLERVADAVHGADAVGADLGPQRLDVAVDGAGARRVRPVPDVGQQALTGEHLARRRGEPGEQVELRRRQPHLLPRRDDPSRPRVDDQVADDETGRRARGELGGPVDAPQQGPDARHQLAHPERLGEVVVGPDREPDQDVGLVVARGQHQHRHRGRRLDAPADLEPVEAGQHHVEDDEVGPTGGVALDRTRAVVRLVDGEPLGPQPVGDGLVDDALVLDDEHAAGTHAASVGGVGCRTWP